MRLTFLKRISWPMIILGMLTLSACSKYTDPNMLSAVNFNNRFVEVVNPIKEQVEELQKLYTENVPKEITSETSVDLNVMETTYEELDAMMTKAADLKNLKSRNGAQMKAVLAEYDSYLQTLDQYLDEYDSLLLFYKSGEYKVDKIEVPEYDKRLNEAYVKLAEEHNKMVERLEKFKD